MVKWLVLSVCLTVISPNCNAWESPIDARYRLEYHELYSRLETAMGMIDNYEGDLPQLTPAGSILNKIVDENENFLPVYYWLARFAIEMGEKYYIDGPSPYLASEKFLTKATSLEPEYAEAWSLMGAHYLYTLNLKKSKFALEKADRIGTNSPWHKLHWGHYYKSAGAYEKSIAMYKMVLTFPEEEYFAKKAALHSLILIYRTMGDNENFHYWNTRLAEFSTSAYDKAEYANYLLFHNEDIAGAEQYVTQALSIENHPLARELGAIINFIYWNAQVEKAGLEDPIAKRYFFKAIKLRPFHRDELLRRMAGLATARPALSHLVDGLENNLYMWKDIHSRCFLSSGSSKTLKDFSYFSSSYEKCIDKNINLK